MKGLRLVWYRLWQRVAGFLFVLVFGLRVHHRRRFPRTGGVLVVANHQSYLDPILAAAGMPRAFHPMARESLFRFAPFRWLIRSLYAFPVRRGTADLVAVKEALRRLKAGGVVLVFPEGTRTRDGSIGPMHGGPAAIAARAGVPIVPMVIDGAFEAWPRTHVLPRPGCIRVACGWPVSVGGSGADDPEAVMAAVRRKMLDLQAELRRNRRPQ